MATIYIALDAGGEPLYVGQTTQEIARLEQHRCSAPWWRQASSVELIHLPRRAEIAALEALLIAELQPPYNRQKARVSHHGRRLFEGIMESVRAGNAPEDMEIPRMLAVDESFDGPPRNPLGPDVDWA